MTNRHRGNSTPNPRSTKQALLKSNLNNNIDISSSNDDDDPSVFFKEIKSNPSSRSSSPRHSNIIKPIESIIPPSPSLTKSDWHKDRYEQMIERSRKDSNDAMLSLEKRITILELGVKYLEEEQDVNCCGMTKTESSYCLIS